MKKCFFIVNKRHDYFNFAKLYPQLKDSFQFFLIIQDRYYKTLSSEFARFMQEIIPLEKITFEYCQQVISQRKTATDSLFIVCTDEKLLMVGAQLREFFGASGAQPYQYVPFSTKRLMKEILQARGISVPRFVDFVGKYTKKTLPEYHDFLSQVLDGDYILKPLDGAASMDVAKISRKEDLERWYQNSYKDGGDFSAEEFIISPMYFCDSFVVNQQIQFAEVSQYINPCLEFLEGKPAGGFPVPREDPIYSQIQQFNRKVISALQPPNGSLHMECMFKEGHPIFIEIGARPPGGPAVVHHEKNFAINLYEWTLRNELGLPVHFSKTDHLYHSWIILSTYPGTVKTLTPPLLKSQTEIQWFIQPGDHFPSFPPNINEGFSALVSLYNPNYVELMEDIEILRTHQPYQKVSYEHATM